MASKYYRLVFASFIITKPLVDIVWEDSIVYGLNAPKIFSALFIIFGIIFLFKKKSYSFGVTILLFWLLFILSSTISILFIKKSTYFFITVEHLLRTSIGLLTFLIVMNIFDREKHTVPILVIYICAACVPLLIWLIPALLGNSILSNDPLERIIGPYHDFWNFMFYGTLIIFACLALLAVIDKGTVRSEDNAIVRTIGFLKRKNILSAILWFLIIVGIFMVYKCYTKAGWVTISVCLLLWFLLRKKYVVSVLIPVLIALFISITPFSNEFRRTFSDEIEYYISGNENSEEVFRGRLSRWEEGMLDFKKAPVVNRLFGIDKIDVNPENDYLRVLWDNGIIGFLMFLALLVATGYLLIKKYVKNKDPVALLGIIVWVMYLLHSIGCYPMLYPAFQWLMWGIIGFVLSENSMKLRAVTKQL